MGASRKALKELMTTTTNPVLLQIGELFLSEKFDVLSLVEMAMPAHYCPFIAHDPTREGEWALAAD